MTGRPNDDAAEPCAVCSLATNTGVRLAGPAPWVARQLDRLGVPLTRIVAELAASGVPPSQATRIVVRPLEQDPSDPGATVLLRICRGCARRSGTGFPVNVLDGRDPQTVTPNWRGPR